MKALFKNLKWITALDIVKLYFSMVVGPIMGVGKLEYKQGNNRVSLWAIKMSEDFLRSDWCIFGRNSSVGVEFC